MLLRTPRLPPSSDVMHGSTYKDEKPKEMVCGLANLRDEDIQLLAALARKMLESLN